MKVAIIGLGYVGLPLWINFSKKIDAIGFDLSKDKVDQLNAGKSYISHFSDEQIQEALSNNAYATDDFSKIAEVDFIIICVPTPLTKNREPDLSYVKNAMELIEPNMREGQLISLESTTYPGTTEELIASVAERKGFIIGENYFCIYSPERENPGSDFKQTDIPKLVGGISTECATRGENLYKQIFKQVVKVNNVKVAELAKLLENIHRAVNLGMINEFKMICDKMSIDPFEVVDAAATKPFGFVPYYPGPGWGGHCIPIDPFYLSWKANEFGISARFIELSGEMNIKTIEWVKSKVIEILNTSSLSLSNSKILVLGLAYKENVDDARESPALELFDWMKKSNANVDYCDPYFPEFPKTRKYQYSDKSISLSKEKIQNYDLVLLLTKHSNYDYELIEENAKKILDTKGHYKVDNKKVFRG